MRTESGRHTASRPSLQGGHRRASLATAAEFRAAPNVQPPESLEELPQVLNGGISEDLRRGVVQARQAFSEVGREPLEFRGEGLLGQLDG